MTREHFLARATTTRELACALDPWLLNCPLLVVARAKRRSRIMNRQGRLFHYSKPASGASLAALTPDLKSHLRVSFWAPDVSSDSLEGCRWSFYILL
jgi:hypothetical protein